MEEKRKRKKGGERERGENLRYLYTVYTGDQPHRTRANGACDGDWWIYWCADHDSSTNKCRRHLF